MKLIDNLKKQPNLSSKFKNAMPLSYYKVTKKQVTNAISGFFSYSYREKFVKQYGWSIITKEQLDFLAMFLRSKKVIDVAGGSGLITSELRRRRVDITLNDIAMSPTLCRYYRTSQIVPVDIAEDICKLDTSEYNAFIFSWPSYDEKWTSDALAKLKSGDIVVYLGEGEGGCTGDRKFHKMLSGLFIKLENISEKLNDDHIQFGGIHDWWRIYIKK